MQCGNCHIPMNVENEAKENGFWFLWYRCSVCNEGYLHKSPLPSHPEPKPEPELETNKKEDADPLPH